MLFVTNRTPIETSDQSVSRNLNELPLINFSVQNTAARTEMLYCQRIEKNSYREINSDNFWQELTQQAKSKHILFYLHGFNCTFEKEIFPDTKNLQNAFNQVSGESEVYIVPLIWPCDDDCWLDIADDYFDDQKAADASATAFSGFLNIMKTKLTNTTENKRKTHFLIHSMGTRVFHLALTLFQSSLPNRFDQESQKKSLTPFIHNIFIVAPDIENTAFEATQPAYLISTIAKNIVIYYAVDDLAMSASELANLKFNIKTPRLGKRGLNNITNVRDNIYQVDCKNFNNRFELIIGHRYFILDPFKNISPVIYHVSDAIKSGRVLPNTRSHILK